MQTTNLGFLARRIRFPDQEPFDLEFLFSDAMGFIPVNLSLENCTIGQAHRGNALPFAPATRSVNFLQARKLSNRTSAGDSFPLLDFAENLESRHARSLGCVWKLHRCGVLENEQSAAVGTYGQQNSQSKQAGKKQLALPLRKTVALEIGKHPQPRGGASRHEHEILVYLHAVVCGTFVGNEVLRQQV